MKELLYLLKYFILKTKLLKNIKLVGNAGVIAHYYFVELLPFAHFLGWYTLYYITTCK